MKDDDTLRYDKMVEQALKGVVRDALVMAATSGLPGSHHFYITFKTKAPGVCVSDRIKARYPDEMTIVLQHQFWELEVDDQGFSVTLSFSGVSERLTVSFDAVIGFADPSVQFGLQFEVTDPDEETEPDPGDGAEMVEQAASPDQDIPPEGAKVIALDAFRKK